MFAPMPLGMHNQDGLFRSEGVILGPEFGL